MLKAAALVMLSMIYAATVSAEGVSATAVIDMTNFQILGSDGQVLDATEDFDTLTFTGTADVDVSLGAATDDASGTNPPTNPLDLGPLCLGDCPVISNNVFPVISGPPTSTYSTADQNESGAPIAGIPGFSTGASVGNASYVAIDAGNDDASANTNNNLNANWVFTLLQDGGITFRFDMRAYLEAHVAGLEVFPSFATAGYSVRFTITDMTTGNDVFTWRPDGASGGIVGGIVNSDPFDLVITVSVNAPLPLGVDRTITGDHTLGTASTGTFSATTDPLSADTLYQLSARVDVNADALRVEVPLVLGCRMTGGGVAVDDTFLPPSLQWDGTLVDGECVEPNGINRYQFGGQAGASTALPPQPSGEWQHHQQQGPSGRFSFHTGTSSAPAGTEIIEIRCSDPGGCSPSGNPPSPNKQLDFDCIGTFRNIGNGRNGATWLIPSPNVTAEGRGNQDFDGTFHYCEVNVDDLGEGPGPGVPGTTECPAIGFGEKGVATLPANCDCPDFYRITIYDGVNAADVVWLDGQIVPSSLNQSDVIYEVEGYLGLGGNGIQLHHLTGRDRQ